MEQAILARIRAARPRLTLLVVAHRAAIARMAERVIVMAAGRAVESGPPEDLLQKPGAMFAALAGPAVRQQDAIPLPDGRVQQ
jgi:ABC-type multidrug transport system fused ATPase/permease subunit